MKKSGSYPAPIHTEPAFIVDNEADSPRAGERAEIVGYVLAVFEEGDDPERCYRIRYSDGEIAYVPVERGGRWQILRRDEPSVSDAARAEGAGGRA